MFSKKYFNKKFITIRKQISKNNALLYYNLIILTIILNLSSNIKIKCQQQQQQQTWSANYARKQTANLNSNSNLNLNPNLASLTRDLLIEGKQQTQTTTTTTTPSPIPLPEFSEPIENQTVALGRDAQLSCKIENLGNFRTAWLRVEDKGILTIHNNIITRNYRFGLINNDDGKNFILTIKNVQASDRGGYMCQINSVPMKYAVGYLDVLTPPAFDDNQQQQQQANEENYNNNNNNNRAESIAGSEQQQLVSGQTTPVPAGSGLAAGGLITVHEGGNATLSCRANGHPQPVITWRREDNEPILLSGSSLQSPFEETQQRSIKFEGPTLQLSSVTRLNSGAYLCIASNGVQPSASKRQILDVQYSPILRIPETEVGAQLNQQSVKLSCFVESNPMGTYHWVKLSNTFNELEENKRRRTNVDEINSSQSVITTLAAADDLSLIEHDELLNSDKFEIVIKHVSSEKVQMILNIRQLEKQDFSWYKCISKNSLGIQSNVIRLYETTAEASGRPSASATSTFTFSNMFFNRASSNTIQLNDQQQQQQQQDENDMQQQQAGRINNNKQQQQAMSRAHTRSSWLQRPNGALGSANNNAPRTFETSQTKALLGDNNTQSSATPSHSSAFILILLMALLSSTRYALLLL